ncbi:hypothetical protein WG906_02090 [Pedobacter sp. P351]|uniref:hypothetical protein n=1 Tax=Pedobacter superstes TaxID=3133441 RepID=UPI0030B27615
MTTIIEESQLNTELQELYLISKHWISDLEFFHNDLIFLQKLVDRGCSQLKKHETSGNMAEMKIMVTDLKNSSALISENVISYLSLLEPMIKNSDKSHYELSLIETHSHLECEIDSLLQTFKSVKQRVFKLTSERIKAVNAKLL